MRFAQIIEFKTSRIDDFNSNLDGWISSTEGSRVPHRAVLRRDRAADDLYLLMVEFSSYDQGLENSNSGNGGVRGIPGRHLRRTTDVPRPGRPPRRGTVKSRPVQCGLA